MAKTILAAIRDSVSDRSVLNMAIDLARDEEAKLVICHVINRSEDLGVFNPTAEAALVFKAESMLEEAIEIAKKNGIEATKAIRVGKPSERVSELAKQLNASNIILGNRKLKGIRQWLFSEFSTGFNLENATLVPVEK
ncbi:Nucleotide-binding universal stress protein, UspA family [Thermodesulfobium acidiphilum]|uniref:Nucleotide-binding universal stress protein, UspA family n=1 Tax=Thermodesulfobium acidiphilum TaxID=1794699 RepID=A0A2R4VYZ8_THEAF|nr:universal stress protein [Thermodesulfobium acidiphilum]AWB09742.1 Nucleotide-binding universal stress protein, UspA family [Thermodesulfobium acidiphilum]